MAAGGAGAVTGRRESATQGAADHGRDDAGRGDAMGEARADDVLGALFAVIEERRKGGDPDVSYVARSFARGTAHIAKKVGEEGVETALAGALGDRANVVAESADLLFHLLMLWSATGVAPDDVFGALSQRRGVSGLARGGRGRAAGEPG